MIINKKVPTKKVENKTNNIVTYNNRKIKNQEVIENCVITVNGQNNKIILNSTKGKGKIYLYLEGNNCTLSIGKNNIINHDLYISFLATSTDIPNKIKIEIGNNNFFNGQNNKIVSPITTNLYIGNGNLFASDITIWGRNDHVIYDIDTGEQLNEDKPIYIGDNNWICNNVSILPGGKIKNNCVVGYGTLLNKEFSQNNVLIAGAPPKVRRENINWSVSSDINRIDKKNNLKIKEKEI